MNTNQYVISYFNKLGIKASRDGRSFWNLIHDKYGAEIFDNIQKAMTFEGPGRERDLYCIKNGSIELSLDFSRYSADLYRRFFEWYLQNDAQNPESILDLGCDNGIVTCFMALTHPQAKVTGIDTCENALNCGRSITEKIGVKNLEFKHADILEIDKVFSANSFDLILSVRTLHEAVPFPEVPDLFWSLEELEQSDISGYVSNQLIEMLKKIRNLLTFGKARFISYDRLLSIGQCLQWLKTLQNNQLYFDIGKLAVIKFHELEDEQKMPAIITTPDGQPQKGLSNRVMDLYIDKPLSPMRAGEEYGENESELVLNLCTDKEFLSGFQVEYPKEARNKMRVETYRYMDLILLYQYSNTGYRTLKTFSEQTFKAVNEEISQMKQYCINNANPVKDYFSINERDNIDIKL